MTEPAADHVHLDASLEEVDGRGVAEDMRADAAAGAGVVEAGGVAAHDLVDAEAGERSPACREDRGCGAGCRAGRLEQRAEQFGGLSPQRAGPPLVALAVQADHRVLAQIEVPGPEIGRLLHPCPGVVEEQQQRQPAVGRQPAEQLLDLVALEEPRLGRGDPLHRDARHPLADGEHLR